MKTFNLGGGAQSVEALAMLTHAAVLLVIANNTLTNRNIS